MGAGGRATMAWSPGMQLGSGAGGSADDLDVFRLGSFLALGDVELDLLPFLQAAVAAAGDRAEVHEHVLATIDRDEAVALVAVEPLHSPLRHLDLLVVDAAPGLAVGAALAPCFGQPVTDRAAQRACKASRGARQRRCGARQRRCGTYVAGPAG